MRRTAFGINTLRIEFLLLILCGLSPAVCHADRAVLSPEARQIDPDYGKLEFFIGPSRNNEYRAWAQYGTPEGLELEFNRVNLQGDGKARNSFNIQYPVIYDLGVTPAFSVGIRDLVGTGLERQSVYFVIGKSLALPDRTARWLRNLQVNVGAGTGYMHGLFASVQARLRYGFGLQAEIFRNRTNVSVSLPLVRNLQARAYSVNGDLFYGLTYSILP